MEQWYENVPVEVNVKLKVPPLAAMIGELQTPESLVEVCGAPVLFVQMTVVPTLMLSVAGLKPNWKLDATMSTTTVAGLGVGVAVGAGGGGGVGCGVPYWEV
jgi:hypothetical protein